MALEHDRGALQALHLIGRRKQTLAGWIAQAQQFYAATLANGAVLYKLLLASPAACWRMAHSRWRLSSHATPPAGQQRGTAQNATCVRDAAMTELDSWMRDLKKIARVALKDRPQLLEQIGVTV